MNKKLLTSIIIISILLFSLVLFACNDKKNTNTANSNNERPKIEIDGKSVNDIENTGSEQNPVNDNESEDAKTGTENTNKTDKAESNNEDTKQYEASTEGMNLKPILFSPESFIYDENSGYYFISNVNGESLEKNDNGYISKMTGKLKLIDDFFIDGSKDGITLNAPKGMTVYNKILYVTDIDAVRGFDVITGKKLVTIENSLKSNGAKSLNDITNDNKGNLYVTDTMAGLIYKIDTNNKNEVSVFSEIESPNGICYDKNKDKLYVALWEGKGVYKLSTSGIVESMTMFDEIGNLDGVDIYNGEIYISDFTEGIIYKFKEGTNELNVVKEGLKTPADINIDRVNKKLLIPLITAQDYETVELE